mmetsp:Transcript_3828/g.14234  ORF Transcript_3828/g.14234 Transcript_3828/m.14234 type:complete len:96 (+) Transcript_3828:85-372(+)
MCEQRHLNSRSAEDELQPWLASSSKPTIAATRPRHTGHWKLQVELVIFAQAEQRQTCLQWRIATSRGFDRQMTQSPPSISELAPSAMPFGFGSVP